MRVVTLPAGGPHPAAPMLVEGGYAAVHGGGVLRIFDIRGPEPKSMLEVSGAVAAVAVQAAILVLDDQGLLTRWERKNAQWLPVIRFQVPSSEIGDELAAPPSGGVALIDGKRGLLVDLEGERILSELEAHMGTARPRFDRLPDGRDVLFAAAPGYMSVRMLDARSGDRIAEYEEQTSTDFCHVDFRLAHGGSRLVTFGCVWAWPYEVRIYDVTPWTVRGSGATPAQGFPLPLVRRIEPLASNTLLAAHVDHATADLTSACMEDRADLLPDEGGDVPAGLRTLRVEEPELAAQLERVAVDERTVLIARRIDPGTGRTESSSVHAIPGVSELHVHYATEHRVVIAGPRLLVCNARDDRLDDFGELRLELEARTAITPDGTSLIVVSP